MTAGFRSHVSHSTNARYAVNGSDSSASSPRYGHHHGSYFARSFNSNAVVVMAVLLFALVVAAFINIIARCMLRRRRQQQPQEANAADKGLDKSVIEALPVVAYGTESLMHLSDPTGDNECVVCLSEFMEGEKLRLLPKCQHGFHLSCIDTWLLTHTTCPVCRRSVVSTESSDDCAEPGPSCSRPMTSGSARIGSSRFGSARIASVDIEMEPSGQSQSTSDNTTDSATPAASTSSSCPKTFFSSILPTEAMASIITSVGSRRISFRNQNQHQHQAPVWWSERLSPFQSLCYLLHRKCKPKLGFHVLEWRDCSIGGEVDSFHSSQREQHALSCGLYHGCTAVQDEEMKRSSVFDEKDQEF